MSPLVGGVFLDTCTLSNFAVVDRLDLLDTRYGYRARWTETIRYEVARGARKNAFLQKVLDATWLGEPIEISAGPPVLAEIDRLRRALGGTNAEPTKHLGEAEIIYYLETVERAGMFVTDDRPALDFARRRGVVALDSADVLGECYSQDEIGCPAAYRLLEEMADRGRSVRIPPDHSSVCPG